MIKYLTYDEVVLINKEVLKAVTVKKADKFELLSRRKVTNVLEAVEKQKGDVINKAVVLLKGLVQEQSFASGNRRTALVTAIKFLEINGRSANFEHNPKFLQGIRENFYSDNEIHDWLLGGEMREFKR